MDMDRFPPSEHFDSARHKDELTQAARLQAALELNEGPLEGWRWPIFSREITYRSESRMTEFDALLWVPDLGFVILDFKTADARLSNALDIDQLFEKSYRQSAALREWLDWYNRKQGLEQKGFATPRVLPLVGFLKGPSKIQARKWEIDRRDRGKVPIPGVGTELWVEGNSEELAQHLLDLVKREMGNKARHTTHKGSGKPWGLAEATEWWKTFEGHTRPARHFGEHLDSALSLSENATFTIGDYNWAQILRKLSMGDALTLIQVPGQKSDSVGEDRLISGGVVRGLAGTGKTWLAWWAGIRLASQGRKALVLCRSARLVRELNRDTRAWLNDRDDDEMEQRVKEGLLIMTPQTLFDAGANSRHHEFQPLNAEHWQELAANHAGSFDAVLVDEAQDFGTLSNGLTAFNYLSTLLRFPRDGASKEGDEAQNPVFLLFGDSGQNTAEAELGANWTPPEEFVELMDLRTNLRSTREIAHQINILVGAGYDWPESNPREQEPEVRFEYLPNSPTSDELWKRVNRELQKLPNRLGHYNRGNPFPKAIAERIAILCDDPAVLSNFLEKSTQLSRQAQSGLTFATVDDFKGSERDIVLLVLTRPYEDIQSLKAIVYTGMSRARGELVILHNQERLK